MCKVEPLLSNMELIIMPFCFADLGLGKSLSEHQWVMSRQILRLVRHATRNCSYLTSNPSLAPYSKTKSWKKTSHIHTHTAMKMRLIMGRIMCLILFHQKGLKFLNCVSGVTSGISERFKSKLCLVTIYFIYIYV